MKKYIFLLVLVFSGSSHAAVEWVDWTSVNSGTLSVDGEVVNVTATGPASGVHKGDHYYNNFFTGGVSETGTYAGLNPTDAIETYSEGVFSIGFDREVSDIYMSIISMGSKDIAVTYEFSNPIEVISSGDNFWGYEGYSLVGTAFTGNEYNGVFKLEGTFGPEQNLEFMITTPENWHGFNFGIMSSVPEPSTYSLMLGGLGLVGLMIRLRRKQV